MNVELLVAGVISLDTYLYVPFIPGKDSECFALSTQDLHGGAAANVAAYSSFFGGLSVGLIARIGDDPIGEILINRLSQYNINISETLHTPGMPSTHIYTIIPPDGSRSYIINSGSHLSLSRRDIPPDYLSARGFYLAPCSPEIHADLMDFASSKDWIIYFNPGTVYMEQADKSHLLNLISESNILFLNETEALTYSGKSSIFDAGKFFLGYGPDHVIVTASSQGCFVFLKTQKDPLNVSSKKIDVANTIGAGDAFAAGFISEHLKTGDINSALVNGMIFSTYSITCNEVREANPSPMAMKEFASKYNQL